jgi:hypothetical protein
VADLWRRVSNSILDSMQFERELGDPEVARFAHEMIRRPFTYLTTEQEYAAITEALGTDVRLTELIPGPHREQEYRDFLKRLLDRLDAMRPWPEPPLRPVDVSQWPDLADAQLVARIRLGPVKVEERLQRGTWQDGDLYRRVMALRLRSGTELALVARWWPDSKDVALLLRDPHEEPPAAVAEFRSATGLGADEITLLAG